MPVDIIRIHDESVTEYFREVEREARSTFWNFSVVWHEQTHDVAAKDGEAIVGAARVRIAASLAHIEGVIVRPEFRRHGAGRMLLDKLEEISNYYNCHKMTIEVPHGSA
ncbi:MAG: GNAT family N-acetyltransferase, partial [Candidatus Eremiobacteraeota bacterium]|nr:GNAT family N-acetyltransferase [Candidatus Eremiobacteraeota bacterium]